MYRSIPTPSTSSLHLGVFTIHFYALCIIAGIAVAIWFGDRRFQRLGGAAGVVADVAFVSVPAGIVGGRLYHVITSPEAYFGQHGIPLDAFKIWEGGLGIWGAIALGTAAAYWKFRRLILAGRVVGKSFSVFADALAPGLLIAQGIGRLGNWFNGELFGRPTDLPWGLRVPVDLRPPDFRNFETFHPTFLYEMLWCFLLAALILRLERRWFPSQVFFFYISAYSLGRLFIELLRVDQAHTFFGLRLNVFVSATVVVGGTLLFWNVTRVMKGSTDSTP